MKDAIDAISTLDRFGIDERNRVVRWHEGLEPYVKLRDVVLAIEKLSSAQRKGKWIRGVCNNCGCDWSNYSLFASVPNYCPDCGANMRGEEV